MPSAEQIIEAAWKEVERTSKAMRDAVKAGDRAKMLEVMKEQDKAWESYRAALTNF